MSLARSPAQIEAARRNGAKSRGPVTEEGKARSSMNALRHGLAAKGHLLTEAEDPHAWDELVAGLVEEHAPETETESRLVLRLASALWRQDRADRMEQAMFIAAPRPEYLVAGRVEHAAPEETFELARLDAIRRYRADASREASRLLRELRQLWADAAGELRNEPDALRHPPARPVGQGAGASFEKPERPASPDGPVEPGHDTVVSGGGLRAPGDAANRNEPDPSCLPPARPGGQDLGGESRPRRLDGPVEPGQGKDEASTESRNEPERRPNRAQRRRLAALARQAARRAA